MSMLLAKTLDLNIARKQSSPNPEFYKFEDSTNKLKAAAVIHKISNYERYKEVELLQKELFDITSRIKTILRNANISTDLENLDFQPKDSSTQVYEKRNISSILRLQNKTISQSEMDERRSELLIERKEQTETLGIVLDVCDETARLRDQILLEIREGLHFLEGYIGNSSEASLFEKKMLQREKEAEKSFTETMASLATVLQESQKWREIAKTLFSSNEISVTKAKFTQQTKTNLKENLRRASHECDKMPEKKRSDLMKSFYFPTQYPTDIDALQSELEKTGSGEHQILLEITKKWQEVGTEIRDIIISVHETKLLKRRTKLLIRRALYLHKMMIALLGMRTNEVVMKEKEINRLKIEIRGVFEKVDYQQNELKNAKDNVSLLQRKNNKLTRENNNFEERANNLNEKYKDKDKQVEELHNKISELFNALSIARISHKDLISDEEWEKTKKLQSLQRNQESLILEKDQTIEQLKTDHEDELTKKNLSLTEAIEKIQLLQEKLEDQDKKLSYINKVKDQTRTKLSNSILKLEEAEKDLVTVRSELKRKDELLSTMFLNSLDKEIKSVISVDKPKILSRTPNSSISEKQEEKMTGIHSFKDDNSLPKTKIIKKDIDCNYILNEDGVFFSDEEHAGQESSSHEETSKVINSSSQMQEASGQESSSHEETSKVFNSSSQMQEASGQESSNHEEISKAFNLSSQMQEAAGEQSSSHEETSKAFNLSSQMQEAIGEQSSSHEETSKAFNLSSQMQEAIGEESSRHEETSKIINLSSQMQEAIGEESLRNEETSKVINLSSREMKFEVSTLQQDNQDQQLLIDNLQKVIEENEKRYINAVEIIKNEAKNTCTEEVDKEKGLVMQIYSKFLQVESLLNRFREILTEHFAQNNMLNAAKLAEAAYNHNSPVLPSDCLGTVKAAMIKFQLGFEALLDSVVMAIKEANHMQENVRKTLEKQMIENKFQQKKTRDEENQMIKQLEIEVKNAKIEIIKVNMHCEEAQDEIKDLKSSNTRLLSEKKEFLQQIQKLFVQLEMEKFKGMDKKEREQLTKAKKNLENSLHEAHYATNEIKKQLTLATGELAKSKRMEQNLEHLLLYKPDKLQVLPNAEQGHLWKPTDNIKMLLKDKPILIDTIGNKETSKDELIAINSQYIRNLRKVAEQSKFIYNTNLCGLNKKTKFTAAAWSDCMELRLVLLVKKYWKYSNYKNAIQLAEARILLLHDREIEVQPSANELNPNKKRSDKDIKLYQERLKEIELLRIKKCFWILRSKARTIFRTKTAHVLAENRQLLLKDMKKLAESFVILARKGIFVKKPVAGAKAKTDIDEILRSIKILEMLNEENFIKDSELILNRQYIYDQRNDTYDKPKVSIDMRRSQSEEIETPRNEDEPPESRENSAKSSKNKFKDEEIEIKHIESSSQRGGLPIENETNTNNVATASGGLFKIPLQTIVFSKPILKKKQKLCQQQNKILNRRYQRRSVDPATQDQEEVTWNSEDGVLANMAGITYPGTFLLNFQEKKRQPLPELIELNVNQDIRQVRKSLQNNPFKSDKKDTNNTITKLPVKTLSAEAVQMLDERLRIHPNQYDYVYHGLDDIKIKEADAAGKNLVSKLRIHYLSDLKKVKKSKLNQKNDLNGRKNSSLMLPNPSARSKKHILNNCNGKNLIRKSSAQLCGDFRSELHKPISVFGTRSVQMSSLTLKDISATT